MLCFYLLFRTEQNVVKMSCLGLCLKNLGYTHVYE